MRHRIQISEHVTSPAVWVPLHHLQLLSSSNLCSKPARSKDNRPTNPQTNPRPELSRPPQTFQQLNLNEGAFSAKPFWRRNYDFNIHLKRNSL